MATFRYEAREAGGAATSGTVEAESRQGALDALARRGLFPSNLSSVAPGKSNGTGDKNGTGGQNGAEGRSGAASLPAAASIPAPAALRIVDGPATGSGRGRISRKEVTAFTRELATLLAATIPIPSALEGLGSEEENPALRDVILRTASAVRRGEPLSAALAAHPRLFGRFFISMVRVGEESGALDHVLVDLADILEREDEIRGEVLGAVAYPCFVLGLGVLTTFILLGFVLPRLFGMLEGMLDVLPLPTRILLDASTFLQTRWPWLLVALAAAWAGLRWYRRSPAGALQWDTWKLKIPVVGAVFRSAALGRFARTLGILAKSGVSLLPALDIVRHTIGNRLLEVAIEKVTEETRGGDSLAAPLKRTGLFPATLVQMLAVGEESGKLDEMLLRVASIEERQMRARSRTVISLLAPALILVVGAFVGFIVIALLLPIFRMSQVVR